MRLAAQGIEDHSLSQYAPGDAKALGPAQGLGANFFGPGSWAESAATPGMDVGDKLLIPLEELGKTAVIVLR